MSTNWGETVGIIKLSNSSELHINKDGEFKGQKVIVLAKWVTIEGGYNGPAKGGTFLVPETEKEKLKEIIAGL